MALSVMLLAAGYGTRLYPLTKHTPKALLPVRDDTVILDELMHGVNEIPGVSRRILVTNSRFAGQFRDWAASRKADVQIIDDGTDTPETRLGAIRDLELARTQGGAAGDLLVLGTDNLFGWPLADFVRQAQAHCPHPTIGLWQTASSADATQFGVVVRDTAGRIQQFLEKPKQPPSTEVALALYYYPEPMLGAIQRFLQSGGNADAPGYFVEWLVGQGTVYGALMRGAWYDIGTPESYRQMQQTWRRPTAARA